VPSFEQFFDRDERLHLFIIARHPRVYTRAFWRTTGRSDVLFSTEIHVLIRQKATTDNRVIV
jgi:hypothetical protein